MAWNLGLLGAAGAPPPGVVLYDNGDENVAVTGGWVNGRTYSVNAPYVRTKNYDHLYIQAEIAGTYRHAIIDLSTNNKIDFSLYSSVQIEMSVTSINGNGSGYAYSTTNLNGDGGFGILAYNSLSRQVVTADISAQTEVKHFAVGVNTGYLSAPANVTLRVYKIELFE